MSSYKNGGKKMVSLYRRKRNGQALAEVLAGAFILVTICLFGIDLLFMAIANQLNDDLAKNAARIAGAQAAKIKALHAAEDTIDAFYKSKLIPHVGMADFEYVSKQTVRVKTIMQIVLPVPFPGVSNLKFQAQAIESITGDVPTES